MTAIRSFTVSRAAERVANLILGGAGAIVAAGVVYVVLTHGTRYPLSGSLGFLAIVLFGSLRLPPALKTAAAALWITGVVAVFAAELASANSWFVWTHRAFWMVDRASDKSKQQIAALGRQFGVRVDLRDRVDVIAELRTRQVDAVPAVMLADLLAGGLESSSEASANGRLLPLAGISNAATVLCNESGEYVTYHSDEHGMRNPRGIWSSARADLAVVGQSFTQQYCVPDGKGFVDLLRVRYPITLNLGISGEGPLLQLAAIREYLPRYAPRIVVWSYTEEVDPPDLYIESTSPLAKRYRDPTFTQHLLTRQHEIDEALLRFVSDAEAGERNRQQVARIRRPLSARAEPILKLWALREQLDEMRRNVHDERVWSTLEQRQGNPLAEALAQAQALTRSWGGTLYVVYLPSWDRYRNGSRAPDRERTALLNIIKALGIPLIDVHHEFAARKDPLSLFPFRRFGHYNEAGHAVVADTVLKFLATHDRITPLNTAQENSVRVAVPH